MSYNNDYNFINIVNYIRKSRKDEERERRTGEDTLAEQKALMTNFLDNMGIPYIQKFEIGSGDKISTRPVFQEVLRELRSGQFDAIAVKEISRLGRGSMSDMGVIYDLIIEKRIYIITPYKIYDPKNESDLRQIRFEMFLSREEFESIKSRLVGSKRTYAMQGKFMGGNAPYGYQTDKKKMILVPDDEKAKIVQLIFNLYLGLGFDKTRGFRAIANYLTRLGIESPSGNKSWGIATVKNILSNPAYIGEIRYRQTESFNGKKVQRDESEHIVVEDAHEAIIEKEIWDKAQKQTASPKKMLSVKENHKVNELTGLVRCDTCGYKMVTNIYNRKWTNADGSVSEKLTERIRCGYKVSDECISVDYRKIEKALLATLKVHAKIDDVEYREVEDMFFSSSETVSNSEMIITENIDKQRDKLKKRLSFIFDKYESGIYSDEDFLSRKKEIEKELEQLDQIDKKNTPEEVNNTTVKSEVFRKVLTSILREYEIAKSEGNTEYCNELLRDTFTEVLLIRGKKIRLQVTYNTEAFTQRA